jgi:hypothetical protein
MAPKRLKHILEETECLALHKVIAQEEAVIDTIRRVQREHEMEHRLLAEKAIILERTLDATEILREVGSQLCTHFMPLLARLETQLVIQEDDETVLATHLPSTPVFIQSWRVLKDGIIALDTAVKRQLDQTQERITSVTQQLYNTESLRDQMSSTISSFSSMIEHARQSIKSKKGGILHPIRRLPVEILLHIFEDCVNDEINEHHRKPPSIFRVPSTMALRLASVCSRWRDTMLGTPYLWRHLLVDSKRLTSRGGRKHFQSYLKRCHGDEIELTLPAGGRLPDDLNRDTITVQRLNLAVDIKEWPTLPSPAHLWLYRPESARGWEIPSNVISRTTHLTVWNVGISFWKNFKSLTRLDICGVQPASVLRQIISQLPHLTNLDLIRAKMQDGPIPALLPFTHFHLRYLGLSRGWFDHLESALSSGLHLSQLRHLELSDITSRYMATMYPFISTRLGATVVRLDFHGEDCSLNATRSFIDTFRSANTIGCYGRVMETVLGAIYEVRTSRVQTPGEDTIRYTQEVIHAMPKGLEVVMIRNYEGEGRKIDQQLRMMRQNPAADTQPINVVFENCLNILPRIRRELSVPLPPIVISVPLPLIDIESEDPHLGSYQSDCDSWDVNDWILDRLEATDGLGV